MGDGNNQPHGILHYDHTVLEVLEYIDVAKTGEIKPGDILKLINTLDYAYLGNSTLLMHRTTLAEIRS